MLSNVQRNTSGTEKKTHAQRPSQASLTRGRTVPMRNWHKQTSMARRWMPRLQDHCNSYATRCALIADARRCRCGHNPSTPVRIISILSNPISWKGGGLSALSSATLASEQYCYLCKDSLWTWFNWWVNTVYMQRQIRTDPSITRIVFLMK